MQASLTAEQKAALRTEIQRLYVLPEIACLSDGTDDVIFERLTTSPENGESWAMANLGCDISREQVSQNRE